MKTIYLLTIAVLFTVSAAAKTVIENPYYEFRNTSIDNIVKIELDKKETRVTIRKEYAPNWWIKVWGKTYLEIPETGEKLYVSSIEGGEFDKEIFMPASGDSIFVLTFPPIDKKVKTINYYCKENKAYYGVSLDKKQPKKQTQTEIPADIKTWIDAELDKALVKEPSDLTIDKFFQNVPARLIGYMKNYDPRSGFNTALIYVENPITREDFSQVVEFHPDGRFEVTLPIFYPIQETIWLNNQFFDFYLEPGQTLVMFLDFEDMLYADKRKDIRHHFNNIRFMGPLAKTNQDLLTLSSSVENPDPYFVYNKGKEMKPADFEKEMRRMYSEYEKKSDAFIKENTLDTKAITINQTIKEVDFITKMMEYEMSARRNNPDFPMEFYAFLKEMPLDNHLMLISNNYSIFLNRFEYCGPFSKRGGMHFIPKTPEITFSEYLTQKGINIDDLEKDLLVAFHSPNDEIPEIEEFIEENEERFKAFKDKYKSQILEYVKKYVKYDYMTPNLEKWAKKDSVLIHELGLLNSLAYEITKVRSLDFSLSEMDKEEASAYIKKISQQLSYPVLKTQAQALYVKNFPDTEKVGYILAEGKGSDIFKKIIDPHKGKVLFVDFWATTCGPCISGIKQNQEIREKYKNNPHFDFIFITSENQSPIKDYEKFVKEQKLTHIYRLPQDDWNYLRQLFKFSGIPRYVLIDKDGKVLDDDYSMCDLESRIKEMLEEID